MYIYIRYNTKVIIQIIKTLTNTKLYTKIELYTIKTKAVNSCFTKIITNMHVFKMIGLSMKHAYYL